MNGEQFHEILVTAHAAIQNYITVFWGMLFSPRKTISKLSHPSESFIILPGVFLFNNLLISIALPYIPGFLHDGLIATGRQIVAEVPRYLVGILFFLTLLSVFGFGRRLSIERRLLVLSLASVCYPICALLQLPFAYSFREAMRALFVAVFYGQMHDANELKKLLWQLAKSGVPSIWIDFFYIAWWIWLLDAGLAIVEKAPKADRTLRLGYSVLTYLTVKSALIFTICFGGIAITIWDLVDYREMESTLSEPAPDYGKVMKLAAGIADSNYFPAYGRYMAAVDNSYAQLRLLFPDDNDLLPVKPLLQNKQHHTAYSLLKQYLTKKMSNLADVRLPIYRITDAELKKADDIYHSDSYSEAKEVTFYVAVGADDLPLQLLP